MEEKLLLDLQHYDGDSGEHSEYDWRLEGDSDLMKEIKKLGPVPNQSFILNQYHDPAWKTSCTKFAAMNSLWNDVGYLPTLEDVLRIEEASKIAGRGGTGKGWFRGGGVDVLRRDWNTMFPKKEVATFLITLFSDEFREFIKLGRSVVVSINVNLAFWNDIWDGRLDGLNFGHGGGHATVIRQNPDNKDEILWIDSVGGANRGFFGGRTWTMTIDQMKHKTDVLRTMRLDAHVFIPKIIVPMIAKDVPAGQRYSEAVKKIIDTGLMTKDKDGKFNPNAPMTRAMFATVLDRLIEEGYIEKK